MNLRPPLPAADFAQAARAPDTGRRRLLGGLAAASTLTPWPAALALTPGRFRPEDNPADSPVWAKVHASIFEGRPIAAAASGSLVLEAPVRAVDAAVVPIALRAVSRADDPLKRLYLVIDANPSPMSAVMDVTPVDGRAEVELRVRVDGYSHLRVLAETASGRLSMVTRFIKASGGCSAPPGADLAAAAAAMGRLGLRRSAAQGGRPGMLTLHVSHPNHSGLAMDQLTRQFTPAHYVRRVEVALAGRPFFAADVDFSMSENPSFRFALPSALGDDTPVGVEVSDSQQRQWRLQTRLGEAPGAS